MAADKEQFSLRQLLSVVVCIGIVVAVFAELGTLAAVLLVLLFGAGLFRYSQNSGNVLLRRVATSILAASICFFGLAFAGWCFFGMGTNLEPTCLACTAPENGERRRCGLIKG